VLALAGGVLLAGLAWRFDGIVRRLLFIWAEFIRGIPLIFVIFWLYFLLPIITGSDLPGALTVTLALAWFTSAAVMHTTLAGLQALPSGQREAAVAGGLNAWQILRLVLLPQAMRNVFPSLHMVGEQVISNGDEFYMSEDSDAHSILKFIPDLPLNSHLKIKKEFKISRSIRGEYFNYEYVGTALGYWKIVPTVLSRFNNGNYLLKDKSLFQVVNKPSGAVYVYSVYDEDYLIFDTECFVSNADLYIDIKDLESFLPLVNDKLDSSSDSLPKESVSRIYFTPEYNIALYLLMNKSPLKV